MEKEICKHCKEKEGKMRTGLKEESYGGYLYFNRPLCDKCFDEFMSKSLDEMFPLDKFKKKD